MFKYLNYLIGISGPIYKDVSFFPKSDKKLKNPKKSLKIQKTSQNPKKSQNPIKK